MLRARCSWNIGGVLPFLGLVSLLKNISSMAEPYLTRLGSLHAVFMILNPKGVPRGVKPTGRVIMGYPKKINAILGVNMARPTPSNSRTWTPYLLALQSGKFAQPNLGLEVHLVFCPSKSMLHRYLLPLLFFGRIPTPANKSRSSLLLFPAMQETHLDQI